MNILFQVSEMGIEMGTWYIYFLSLCTDTIFLSMHKLVLYRCRNFCWFLISPIFALEKSIYEMSKHGCNYKFFLPMQKFIESEKPNFFILAIKNSNKRLSKLSVLPRYKKARLFIRLYLIGDSGGSKAMLRLMAMKTWHQILSFETLK